MAGYSEKSLHDKLGIKLGKTICITKAPKGYLESLGVKNSPKGPFDFIQIFCHSEKEVRMFMKVLKNRMHTDGMMWICWPKKTSKIRSDLNEIVIRKIGLELGLVDVKVAAIDETWSGLKFVYRLKDRK